MENKLKIENITGYQITTETGINVYVFYAFRVIDLAFVNVRVYGDGDNKTYITNLPKPKVSMSFPASCGSSNSYSLGHIHININNNTGTATGMMKNSHAGAQPRCLIIYPIDE